jgi:hypothetical protein
MLTSCFSAGAVRRVALAVAAAGGLSISGPGMSRAQGDLLDAPMQIVRFGEADTIRGLVGKYLQDPDLWPLVLSLNNISSPADLVPGIKLRLPVRQVLAADTALSSSLTAIQGATAEGARIFAPAQIGSAIENRDIAVGRRGTGQWRQVVSFAGVATVFANEALGISLAQRDRSAEAVVSDVQGDVEGRAPVEPLWSGRDLNDILVEFERMRTLSDSTTQITFRDLSRLRLNSNSNATIQRMRADPLTGDQVTKVSLANGDFYALLNQLSDNNTFEIEVPGIESSTNSVDFWIKNDDSGARFVNYDDKAGLKIDRGGETITLGPNEGVVFAGSDTRQGRVLSAPSLRSPQPGAVLYTGSAALAWEPFEGAKGYWLEVALDPGFDAMQVSQWGIRDTAYDAADLPPSRYHWRVAALDPLGLPGQWSLPQAFTVREDRTPPFLALLSPASGTMVTQPIVEVLGASEPDASLVLNGMALEVGGDGAFLGSVTLVPGDNEISVLATDPAGNQSRRRQVVIYRPAVAVDITLSDDIARQGGVAGAVLVSRSADLSVAARATATPGAVVIVRDAGGGEVVRTVVGADGVLRFSVPVDAAVREYDIVVLAPDGSVEGRLGFGALRDQTPPDMAFDLPPPRVVGEDVLELAGSVADADRLELNGEAVPLSDGRFDLVLQLQAGVNVYDLLASDTVGNVSVTRLQILLDVEPPQILSTDLGRPQGDGGAIELLVEARDASGLRQAAPYVVTVGGVERQGFLRCDSNSGFCRASLPPEKGRLELVEVGIEDYAGNVAFN